MKIKHISLTNKIYLLVFDTQKDITSTFLRFQEHYESPRFRGQVFSLDEYKQWYTQNSPKGKKTGRFTYYSDWNGFNIPSYVLRPFYEGKFDPLSKKEQTLLKKFKDKPEPFYIIGVHRGIEGVKSLLEHEVAHGLFYTDPNYKREVLNAMKKFDLEDLKKELLSNAGYHEAVLEDECHAYSLARLKPKENTPTELTNQLRLIYKKYLKKHKIALPSEI